MVTFTEERKGSKLSIRRNISINV